MIPKSRYEITSVIPNGVDFELFKPLKQDKCKKVIRLDSAKKHVLFISDTEDPRKGFKKVMKAYRKLDNSKYQLVSGERRLRAARSIKLKTIPTYV